MRRKAAWTSGETVMVSRMFGGVGVEVMNRIAPHCTSPSQSGRGRRLSDPPASPRRYPSARPRPAAIAAYEGSGRLGLAGRVPLPALAARTLRCASARARTNPARRRRWSTWLPVTARSRPATGRDARPPAERRGRQASTEAHRQDEPRPGTAARPSGTAAARHAPTATRRRQSWSTSSTPASRSRWECLRPMIFAITAPMSP